jgi:hypothetical protein
VTPPPVELPGGPARIPRPHLCEDRHRRARRVLHGRRDHARRAPDVAGRAAVLGAGAGQPDPGAAPRAGAVRAAPARLVPALLGVVPVLREPEDAAGARLRHRRRHGDRGPALGTLAPPLALAAARRLLPVFEWSTLARPYLLTFLLVVIGAELVHRRRLGVPLAAVLAGLVLTDDASGAVVAAALLTAALAGRRSGGGEVGRRWIPLAGVGAALVTAAVRRHPTRDYGGPTLGCRVTAR